MTMGRYLLEHDDGHIVFESEEDCSDYVAIRRLSAFKINKITGFSDEEFVKLDEMIKEKKINYKKEHRERILKEISNFDFELYKITIELLNTNSENIRTAKLLRNEIEEFNKILASKQKELEKYV